VAKWSEDVGLLPKAACNGDSTDDSASLQCDLQASTEPRLRAADHRYIRGGESAMIDALQGGPLAVSFHSDRSLLDYSAGIWRPEADSHSEDSEDGFIPPTHSALLVGYGEDESTGPYWVLQNAWGAAWGERGGFRISRDIARARGMEDLVVAAEVVQDDKPGVAQEVIGNANHAGDSVALVQMGQARVRSATRGHRGAVLCVEPAVNTGDQSIFVRLDVEHNFRSLSFGESAGTETAVQCVGPTPSTCTVAPAEGEPPQCSSLENCDCDLSGQGLPYPGMQALAERVRLMCVASAAPVRVLLIGLGGGAISSYLQDQCPQGHLHLENVEKEGRVATLSSKFFGFHAGPENTVDVTDGLSAVGARQKDAYDAIIVDCFAGHDRVPEGCRSTQFLSRARALLKSEGVLVQNAWGRSSASEEVVNDFKALLAAYNEAFGQQQVGKEVVFDAPQSLEYVVVGLRGQHWASLKPDA